MNLLSVLIRSVGFLGGNFVFSSPKVDVGKNVKVRSAGFDLKNISKIMQL